MTIKKLLGSAPSQVSRNKDLGTMAFQDADAYFSLNNQPSFRNLVHNGDMRIDQRNNGNAISSNSVGDQWGVDRFGTYASVAGVVSIQQNQGGVTPPPGFSNYIGYTSLVNGFSSTGVCVPNHLIEGNNVKHLRWGTSAAKPITISFWVRSSVAANNHAFFVTNQALNYYYPVFYSITAQNTWEYKTITIPGPTGGTWLTDNSRGICLFFSIGCSSNAGAHAQTTLNTWYAPGATTLAIAGQAQVTANTGNTWMLTGLQIEAGTVATPFEYRPIGVELALCQRYYQYYAASACPQTYVNGTGTASMTLQYKVSMRATPTTIGVGTGAVQASSSESVTTYQMNVSGWYNPGPVTLISDL